jgi:hypothetical protein
VPSSSLDLSLKVWLRYLWEGQWVLRPYKGSYSGQRSDIIGHAAEAIARLIDLWYEEHLGAIAVRSRDGLVVEVGVKTEREHDLGQRSPTVTHDRHRPR